MILVSLGTQDRSFKRLLDAIEQQIKLGNIKDRVVVQAGETVYSSEYMEIFDLIPSKEFLKLLEECDVLICHGGVGTIIDGLKHHKKIIAAARLKEYGEHQNNHQKQIIKEFTEKGLILELDQFDKLDKKLEELKSFEPGEYESNTTHFIEILDHYIHDNLKNGEGNTYRKFMQYFFYGFFAIIFQIICLSLFLHLGYSPLVCLIFFDVLLICYRFVMKFLFFRGIKCDFKGEASFLSVLAIQLFIVSYFQDIFASSFVFKMLLVSVCSFFLIFLLNVFMKVQDVE